MFFCTRTIKILLTLSFFAVMMSCDQEKPLPILGNKSIVDGQEIDHTIPDFSFTNQLGKTITNRDFEEIMKGPQM